MILCGFDVETRGIDTGYGLQPFRARSGEAWLTSVAISSQGKVAGRLRPTTEWLRKWLKGMARSGTRIVGWNTPFDMAWLIALGLREEVYACDWLDAMLLWRHCTASPEWTLKAPPSYGLKAAVVQHYPEHAGYDEGVDFNADTPEELAKLLEYNKLDAKFTRDLAIHFWESLTSRQQANALIEAACLPLVAEAHVEGIVADRDAAHVLAQKLDDASKLAMVKLAFHPMSKGAVPEDVLRSPIKLRKLLYDDWGLRPVKTTEKGQFSTDRDSLSLLAEYDERAALLNEYREANNNRTKFAVGTVTSLDYNGDGRVRPNARVYSTYTGRMTYSSKILKNKDERPTGIALHQWKRDPEFRDLIKAPQGYTLLEFDFAGQEYRWMAVMSRDRTMLELCQPGEDAHAFMGAKVGKENYLTVRKAVHMPEHQLHDRAKQLRRAGKVGNLSLQYRTSAGRLRQVARVQHGLIFSPSEAEAIHATYRVTYPGVPQYWKNQIHKAQMYGWVETIAGRRAWIGHQEEWRRLAVRQNKNGTVCEEMVDNRWQAESTAINFPIQGSGADQKYLALKVLRDYLPHVAGKFYYELHDGIFVVVPDHRAEKATHEIKRLLSNLPYNSAWGVNLPIQFPVDAKAGKTWGTLKEVS
jgi:DNA polymerase-1